MIRTETYLGGRLVKQVGMVNMGPTADKPYDEWVDGRHIWLLDGHEIVETAALLIITPTGQAPEWRRKGSCHEP